MLTAYTPRAASFWTCGPRTECVGRSTTSSGPSRRTQATRSPGLAWRTHSRCSTDEQIKAIAATGGLLSRVLYWRFIDLSKEKATVDRVVDHIAYVAELVGIDHVGIGTDFDGLMPGDYPILQSADQLPRITDAMHRREFSETDIRKVLGKNFLRVFKATIG